MAAHGHLHSPARVSVSLALTGNLHTVSEVHFCCEMAIQVLACWFYDRRESIPLKAWDIYFLFDK